MNWILRIILIANFSVLVWAIYRVYKTESEIKKMDKLDVVGIALHTMANYFILLPLSFLMIFINILALTLLH